MDAKHGLKNKTHYNSRPTIRVCLPKFPDIHELKIPLPSMKIEIADHIERIKELGKKTSSSDGTDDSDNLTKIEADL